MTVSLSLPRCNSFRKRLIEIFRTDCSLRARIAAASDCRKRVGHDAPSAGALWQVPGGGLTPSSGALVHTLIFTSLGVSTQPASGATKMVRGQPWQAVYPHRPCGGASVDFASRIFWTT